MPIFVVVAIIRCNSLPSLPLSLIKESSYVDVPYHHLVCIMSVTGSLSRSEREDLLHMFQLFDTERTGTVSLLELKAVLQQVAAEHDETSSTSRRRQALESLLALPAFQVSNDNGQGDRQLTQEEFIQLITTAATPPGNHNNNDEDDNLRRIFQLFDVDCKGFIDAADLRRMADDLGEDSMNEAELHEMIQRAASTQQGRVTLDDLKAVLNHKLMA